MHNVQTVYNTSMIEAIVIIIFVAAFALVWYVMLYLIKHPNIDFYLEPKVLAHEPDLDDKITKVLTYLHNEEFAEFEEISSLLGTDEIAEDVLSLLVKRDLVGLYEEEGRIMITLL